jgi:hypothetical protein
LKAFAHEDGAGLKYRFQDEDSGHDGPTGIMPLEKRLIGLNFLIGLNAFIRSGNNVVDKQERRPVGNVLKKFLHEFITRL